MSPNHKTLLHPSQSAEEAIWEAHHPAQEEMKPGGRRMSGMTPHLCNSHVLLLPLAWLIRGPAPGSIQSVFLLLAPHLLCFLRDVSVAASEPRIYRNPTKMSCQQNQQQCQPPPKCPTPSIPQNAPQSVHPHAHLQSLPAVAPALGAAAALGVVVAAALGEVAAA
ncbi:uncharacterized protein LOC131383574 [Hylobates moloch]|uniref:uncharacterized protein LOC131383574 n=1 Tax=Hylobates moloch TaxID=81572 RepID=UPI0026752B13|nr:uncharacterized protein LOC131383574 [Hylobates moloch]